MTRHPEWRTQLPPVLHTHYGHRARMFYFAERRQFDCRPILRRILPRGIVCVRFGPPGWVMEWWAGIMGLFIGWLNEISRRLLVGIFRTRQAPGWA